MATKLYAKLTDGQLTTTCAAEEDTELIAQLIADGFKHYDDSAPKPEVGIPKPAVPSDLGDIALRPPASNLDTGVDKVVGDRQIVVDSKSAAVDQISGSKSDTAVKSAVFSLSEPVPTYRDDGYRIVLEWKVVENSPAKVTAEIARLQSELAATDYKVIKSYEYALAGQAAPYDIGALHSSRQALRERIEVLEVLDRA
jgi:hypothetical protein